MTRKASDYVISTRFKLTGILFIATVLANAAFAFVMSRYVSNVLIQEVQTRVRLDLNSARIVYESQLEAIDRVLRAASACGTMLGTADGEGAAGIEEVLRKLRDDWDLDLLTLAGSDGRVICRAHAPSSRGDDLSSIPVVRKALEERKASRGSFLVPREALLRDGPGLADRARIQVLDTPGALPEGKRTVTDGMVVGCAVPIPDPAGDGQVLGVLFGGNLLNRRYGIVDTIKETLFQGQLWEGKDIGTSTVFLGDVRISTNVLNADGSRAVGSRLSAEVAENVLRKGGIWDRRAFVVNDWYLTAYEPIRDPDGSVIGALYVGILEKPFARPLDVIVVFFLVMLAITVLAVLATLVFATKLTLGPIAAIVAMCRKVTGGDLTARVGIRPSGEMGVLCDSIDRMADAIVLREKLLHEHAQRQIGQSEKLASIGRLAAGIAHEINNPLTGVLTFAHLLKVKEHRSEEDRQDLDIIIRETTRVRDIVRGLLDFARQSPPAKELLDLNGIIRLTMKLIRSQKEFARVEIEEVLDDGIPPVLGDRNQLQQVFLNLALNACEAMPSGGVLSIITSLEGDRVHIAFRDTGTGIKAEHLDKIFDPFFTTKPVGKGTGLGLSVSYGTIEGHGGTIEVESEEGKGSAFTIILPVGEAPGAGRAPSDGAGAPARGLAGATGVA